MIIQLGITLIMPILLCIAFCWWLCDAFGVGVWVYIPGILFGLGSSVMSGYKFYRSVMKMQKKKDKKHGTDSPKRNTVAFNDHV